MARTSNSGGDSKTGESKAPKGPAKTPARRRTDKPRQAAANDGAGALAGPALTVSAPGIPTTRANGGPSQADVARLAYELYVQRGCCDGYDREDWFEAERRLRAQ